MEENSRTFTQEEVNTIVQDRLAREKEKHDKALLDMQADIKRRERKLEAREALQQRGLPSELVDLVQLDNDESFNTSLALLEKTYKPMGTDKDKTFGGQVFNGVVYKPASGGPAYVDPIRKAMGLNK